MKGSEMQFARVLKYTAMATVLASPAFAQDASLGSILNPQLLLGTNSQTGTLNATANAVGVTSTAVTSQVNTNNLNQVGGTLQTGSAATPLVSGDMSVGIGQTVGGIPFSATDTSSFTQSTTNAINAAGVGTSGYLANVLAGGNQNAVSGVNTAALGMLNGSSLTLQQAQNGTPAANASSQTSQNTIAAFSNTGNTTVNGYGGAQNAQSGINAGLLSIGAGTNSSGAAVAGTANVALDQVQKGLGAAQTSQNLAAASVQYGTNPVIDPRVTALNQNAGISLNTFTAAGGNLNLAVGPMGVDGVTGVPQGGQNANTGTGTLTMSNQALATTGNTALSTIGAPGLPATGGVGTVGIDSVKQNAGLTINSAGNTGGNLNLGSSVTPFTQNVDAAYTAPVGLGAQTPVLKAGLSLTAADVVNMQTAQTGSGNAAVTGSSTAASQASQQNLNSISSTGAISGALSQTAGGAYSTAAGSPYSGAGITGTGITGAVLSNVATASTTYGGASVTNMGQVQNNTLNSVSGAAGVNLSMQQLAVGATNATTVGGVNDQIASTTGGASTISGAAQALNAGVNVANIGGVLQGTAQQTAKNITTANTNQLAAAGGAAVVVGSQLSTGGVNVIK